MTLGKLLNLLTFSILIHTNGNQYCSELLQGLEKNKSALHIVGLQCLAIIILFEPLDSSEIGCMPISQMS